ncbi:MAG: hypothetical protein RRZ38_19360, partial [Hafnia sp.]
NAPKMGKETQKRCHLMLFSVQRDSPTRRTGLWQTPIRDRRNLDADTSCFSEYNQRLAKTFP